MSPCTSRRAPSPLPLYMLEYIPPNNIMEVTCSFHKKSGGVCSLDTRYQQEVVIPLSSCKKDITNHIRSVGVRDIETEFELILARASIFKIPRDIASWTICPAHRSSLGIGWRRGTNRCRVPEGISEHASKGKNRKANRGISVAECKIILKRTGVFVPVGSGKCAPFSHPISLYYLKISRLKFYFILIAK